MLIIRKFLLSVVLRKFIILRILLWSVFSVHIFLHAVQYYCALLKQIVFFFFLAATGEYEQMTRSQLVSLTLSYDKKVKKLSEDIKTLQAEMSVTNKPDSGLGKPGAGPGPEGGGGKDKYKTLARRLKEERNQYRETCEEKQ